MHSCLIAAFCFYAMLMSDIVQNLNSTILNSACAQAPISELWKCAQCWEVLYCTRQKCNMWMMNQKSHLVVTNCNSIYQIASSNTKIIIKRLIVYITHTHMCILSLYSWYPYIVSCFLLIVNPKSSQAVLPPYSNQIFAAQLNIKSMYSDMQSLY